MGNGKAKRESTTYKALFLILDLRSMGLEFIKIARRAVASFQYTQWGHCFEEDKMRRLRDVKGLSNTKFYKSKHNALCSY